MIFGLQLLRHRKWMDLVLCLKDFQSRKCEGGFGKDKIDMTRWAFQCRSQRARNKLKKAALHVIAGQMTDSQIKDGLAFAKGLALEGLEPKVETILLKEATVTETAPAVPADPRCNPEDLRETFIAMDVNGANAQHWTRFV